MMIFYPTLFLIRVWVLFFDIKLSHLIKNQTWRMAINPTIVSNNNWYLNPKNQRLFANNGKYLCILGYLESVLEVTISAIFLFVLDWRFLASVVYAFGIFVKVMYCMPGALNCVYCTFLNWVLCNQIRCNVCN